MIKHLLRFQKYLLGTLIALIFLFSTEVSGQTITLSTYPAVTGNNGTAGITFELETAQPIFLDDILSQVWSAGTSTYTLWYKPGSYTSSPNVTTANGWIQVIGAGVSASGTGTAGPPVLFAGGLNLLLTPGKYGIHMTTSNIAYKTWAGAPDVFSDAVVTIRTGTNFGYGGAAPNPGFHPRQFAGSINYRLAITAPNDAGVTAIVEPTAGCVGTHNVEAEISNLGTNQINNLSVHWSINGAFQGSVPYSQLLDTANGAGQSVDTVTLGTINFINNGNYNIRAWTVNPNNQFDTVNYNDTSNVSITGSNYPTPTLGADTTICPDQPLTIIASSSNPDSLIWQDTVKSNSRVVTTPGSFHVEIYKNGCLTEDSIIVSLHPPAPGVNLGNDSTFCYGDQIILNAAASGVTYEWQDNSTGATFTVDTAGFYWVTLEDANTCRSSDSIEFGLYKDPSVTVFVSPSTILCYGTPYTFAANGKTNGSEMYQLVINGVNTGPAQSANTYSSPPLNYGDTVRVDLITDQCATSAYQVPSNELVMFINPQPLLINGVTADTVIEDTKKSYAITPNSTSSYLWRVSGGSVVGDSTTFAVQIQWDGPNPNAWVSLTETDANNCSYENVLPVNVISIIGIGEQGNGFLGNAYPNPADESITIPVNSNTAVDISLNVYDLTGKVAKEVFNGTLNGSKTFNLPVADLEEGMYFYKLTTSQGKEMTRKLLIRH